MERTKIDIISGFLGAGKTTLIKKLLKDAFKGEQVVLIEHEFGEIGIDGGFLKEAGIEIREMNSGCICCSLVGDFGASLKEVISKYHPDRILIEPSGVGKLSDVIKAVQGVAEETGLVLNSYTTVVDAKKCKMYMRNFGEFFNNQVEYAGAIIMINPKAAIITTPIEKLEGAKILEVMEHPVSLEQEMMEEEVCPECGHVHEHGHHHHDHDHEEHEQHHDHDHEEHEHHHHDHDHEECGCGHDHDHDHEEHEHHHHDHDHEECGCGHDHDHDHHHDHDHDECGCGHDHHHHHHADEVFTSWGRETIKKYTRENLEKILETLSETEEYGIILRAKGMLPAEDGTWIYFDMVPEETEIRSGAPEYTGRLCVIGSKLNEDKLAELFGL